MRPGRIRPLTPGEARLWAEIARSVAPLKGKTLPVVSSEPDPSGLPPEPVRPAPPPLRPSRPTLKPLAALDSKTVRGLARGRLRADATLDLHGMLQVEAHAALTRFLVRSQASGHRMVTIVTGKGRPGEGGESGERGVLRRMVPHWLGLPALRGIVLGWDEAAPHRGGAGALHVRLRRNRPSA